MVMYLGSVLGFNFFCEPNYCIFRPITRALSIQKGSEIVKNEYARYTLERLPTYNARVICTKKGIGIHPAFLICTDNDVFGIATFRNSLSFENHH